MADRGSSTLDAEFDTFLEERRRIKCLTCQMADTDLREWVEERAEAGASHLALSEFLAKKGVRIGVGALKGHLNNHVA